MNAQSTIVEIKPNSAINIIEKGDVSASMDCFGVQSYKNVKEDTVIENELFYGLFVCEGYDGFVKLEFKDIKDNNKISKIELVLHTAGIDGSESDEGFWILYNDDIIGGGPAPEKESSYAFKLKTDNINNLNEFKLELWANGRNGLFIMSSKSGHGPYLKITY
jgi:hypothetical protein